MQHKSYSLTQTWPLSPLKDAQPLGHFAMYVIICSHCEECSMHWRLIGRTYGAESYAEFRITFVNTNQLTQNDSMTKYPSRK